MRVMAVDYGTKAIGLAICDEMQLTVRPLTTIRREKRDRKQVAERIGHLVTEHQVGSLVVGLPLNMDGTSGDAVEKVERFIADLQEQLSIPIMTIDERLTTYEADQILRGLRPFQRAVFQSIDNVLLHRRLVWHIQASHQFQELY